MDFLHVHEYIVHSVSIAKTTGVDMDLHKGKTKTYMHQG